MKEKTIKLSKENKLIMIYYLSMMELAMYIAKKEGKESSDILASIVDYVSEKLLKLAPDKLSALYEQSLRLDEYLDENNENNN